MPWRNAASLLNWDVSQDRYASFSMRRTKNKNKQDRFRTPYQPRDAHRRRFPKVSQVVTLCSISSNDRKHLPPPREVLKQVDRPPLQNGLVLRVLANEVESHQLGGTLAANMN